MKRLILLISSATASGLRVKNFLLTAFTFVSFANVQASDSPCKSYEIERFSKITSALAGANSVMIVGNDPRGTAWKIEGIQKIVSGCDRQVSYTISTAEDLTPSLLNWLEHSVKSSALGIEEVVNEGKEATKSFRLVIRTTDAHRGLRAALRSFGERVIITEESPGYSIVAPSIDSETVELRYASAATPKKTIATGEFLFRLKDSLGLSKLAALRNARNTESPAYRKNHEEIDSLIELAASIESYYKAFINAIKSNQKALPHTPEALIQDLHISVRIHPVNGSIAAQYFESLFYGPKDKKGQSRVNELAKTVVKSMSHGERFNKQQFEARVAKVLDL